jgi:hypothetical protein
VSSTFRLGYDGIRHSILGGCTITDGALHACTGEGRDGQDEASHGGLPLAAMAGTASARRTRGPFGSPEEVGQRSEKEESDRGELAMVDHDGGNAPVNSKRKQTSNAPLPPRDGLKQEVEEEEGPKAELWPRFGGLRCNGELAQPRGSARR